MNRVTIVVLVLAVSVLACGSQEPRRLNLYPSPTVVPTWTAEIVQITTTPVSTHTPIVREVTETPLGSLCVSATVAVHLRPSPSEENHPVTTLLNGTVVDDLGGRNGKWWFVKYGELSGWVHSSYVVACNSTQE